MKTLTRIVHLLHTAGKRLELPGETVVKVTFPLVVHPLAACYHGAI